MSSAAPQYASVGPGSTTASVAFLVGRAGWPDGFLLQARRWVNQIQKNAGGAPGVQVRDLSQVPEAGAKAVSEMSTASLKARLANGVQDQFLGGLRGHSLVIVTHGLEPPSGTPRSPQEREERDNGQGLLFFNVVKGESPQDVVLTKLHLDFMSTVEAGTGLPEHARVVPSKQLDGIDAKDAESVRFRDQVRKFAPFVDAIRQSVYSRVYLCACGGGRRLERFAQRLSVLTLKTIYFNVHTVSFPDLTVANPDAKVGEISGQSVAVVDGHPFFRFFSGETVKLESPPGKFLPGAEEMAR